MRILLVEDNERLAGFVSRGLRSEGFASDAIHTGLDAAAALDSVSYDAVVLDLGLPDIDGLRMIGDLRRKGNSIPILVMTARDGLDDRVKGLNAGADDYLLKPFAMAELVARLRAMLRRAPQAVTTVLRRGNLSFDITSREVDVGGRIIPISRRELAVLECLMRRYGHVVPRSVLEESVYGFDDDVSPNSIEVAVSRLRKSLRSVDAEIQILTLRGVGYVLKGLDGEDSD